MSMELTKSFQNVGETYIGNTGHGNVYLRLYAKYNTQSIADNKTNVTYEERLYVEQSAGWFQAWSSSGTLTGDVTGTYAGAQNRTYYAGETVLLTVSKDISHADDGIGSVSVGATFTNSFLGGGTATINAVTSTMPTIPRKSSISCPSPFNIGDNVTINISAKNGSFTHTIRYNFEDVGERVIATDITNGTISIPYSWATPNTMYTDGNMENKNSGNGYLTVETFSGDTSLGVSEQFGFTANVTNANPEITATIIDTNSTVINDLTGNANILVKGLSNAQITASASIKKSATRSSYKVVCADKQSTTYPTATLTGVTSGNFVLYVTDSRGNSNGNGTTVSKTMKNYFSPYASSIDIARTEQTSTSVVASITGSWWNDNFGIKANSIKYSYRTRISGGTWSGWSADTVPTKSGNTFTISNLNLGSSYATNTSYDIQFRLKDEVGYYELNTETVTVSTPIIEIYEDEVKVTANASIDNNLIVGNIQGKNLFNMLDLLERYEYGSGASFDIAGNSLIETSTVNGRYNYTGFIIPHENLLGKTVTLKADWVCSNINNGAIYVYLFNSTTNRLGSNIGGVTRSGVGVTFTLPSSFPSGSDSIIFLFYSNASSSSGVVGNTTTYTNVQLEYGNKSTNYMSYQPFIVESGINYNGSWIKYSDGTMVCEHEVVIGSCTFALHSGGLYTDQTHGGYYSWTFPKAFLVADDNIKIYATMMSSAYGNVSSSPVHSNRTGVYIYYCTNYACTTTVSLSMRAVGRWK